MAEFMSMSVGETEDDAMYTLTFTLSEIAYLRTLTYEHAAYDRGMGRRITEFFDDLPAPGFQQA